MELGWSSLDLLGGSRMGRENGEGSRSAPPRVLTLEEAKKRALAAVGGKLEVEEEEVQFQSFLHHHFHYLHQQQQQPPPPLTLTSTSTQKKRKTTATATAGAGRIVAVPGGHIVRSASSKDRHSKVCTAKGLRDRRVRLSAHTAIEFYDVQDRLGYDRPSMAVDWLLKNAKAAIDGLDELPPWQPTAATGGGVQGVLITDDEPVTNSMNSYSDAAAGIGFGIESFPMVPSSYPPDLLSRTSGHVQDLRLSLDTAETTARGSNSVGGGGGGYLFNLPPPQQQQSMMIDPRFFSHQRGPLQSSSSHPVPSWMDQIAPSSHIMSMHPPPVPALFHRSSSSFPSVEFGASGGGGSGFSGFVVPSSWIQGREHLSGDVSDRPPASSHQ